MMQVEPVSRQAKGVVRSAAESAQRLGTLQAGGNAVLVSRKCDEGDSAVPPAQRYSFDGKGLPSLLACIVHALSSGFDAGWFPLGYQGMQSLERCQ